MSSLRFIDDIDPIEGSSNSKKEEKEHIGWSIDETRYLDDQCARGWTGIVPPPRGSEKVDILYMLLSYSGYSANPDTIEWPGANDGTFMSLWYLCSRLSVTEGTKQLVAKYMHERSSRGYIESRGVNPDDYIPSMPYMVHNGPITEFLELHGHSTVVSEELFTYNDFIINTREADYWADNYFMHSLELVRESIEYSLGNLSDRRIVQNDGHKIANDYDRRS